jgi:hypothetical protein
MNSAGAIFICGKTSSKSEPCESTPQPSTFTLEVPSQRQPEIDQSCKLRGMAQRQVRPVDDSQLPASNSSLTVSQRLPDWTFHTTQGHIPLPLFKVGNGQCTHLTMTRLYNTEFRCSLCLRVGSMGWIYRCTQDRDLLIEDDMERGNEVSTYKICVGG